MNPKSGTHVTMETLTEALHAKVLAVLMAHFTH